MLFIALIWCAALTVFLLLAEMPAEPPWLEELVLLVLHASALPQALAWGLGLLLLT